MKLETVTLRVTFGETVAVNDVSFALPSGELAVIVGPNGSGKTTLLRAMLGLVSPATGRVLLDGRDLTDWTRRQLAGAVAALPQREEPAFPLTVRETLLMGRWSQLGPLQSVTPDDEHAITQALARCDVSGFEARRVDSLSGGEWQRVRLARALAATPRLLLLDEPTAALDIGHEMALFDLLRRLVREGLGVLAITHDLNLAARYADRVLLLHRGAAIAEGPPADVITGPLVSRVFDWPIAVTQFPGVGPVVVPLPKQVPAGIPFNAVRP